MIKKILTGVKNALRLSDVRRSKWPKKGNINIPIRPLFTPESTPKYYKCNYNIDKSKVKKYNIDKEILEERLSIFHDNHHKIGENIYVSDIGIETLLPLDIFIDLYNIQIDFDEVPILGEILYV